MSQAWERTEQWSLGYQGEKELDRKAFLLHYAEASVVVPGKNFMSPCMRGISALITRYVN